MREIYMDQEAIKKEAIARFINLGYDQHQSEDAVKRATNKIKYAKSVDDLFSKILRTFKDPNWDITES